MRGSLLECAQGGRVTRMGLTARDRAILDFERTWWTAGGVKADAIRADLGLSAARYYQLRERLLGSREAELYDPLVVRRLRRSIRQRRRARFEGRPIAPSGGPKVTNGPSHGGTVR